MEINPSDLAKVTVTGSTHDVTFTVPDEVVKVDANNKLSITGLKDAFKVYGRTTMNDLGGSTAATNNNFMPLELLSYYLGGKLDFDSKNTLIVKATPVIDVVKTYGDTFGFNKANITPTKVGT